MQFMYIRLVAKIDGRSSFSQRARSSQLHAILSACSSGEKKGVVESQHCQESKQLLSTLGQTWQIDFVPWATKHQHLGQGDIQEQCEYL